MVSGEEPKQTPNEKYPVAQNRNSFISPRFKSLAAMAGWDEESIIIASLVVEDTPDRDLKLKRRTDHLHFKTPPSSSSRRKRRPPTRSPVGVLVPVLNLEEEQEDPKQEGSERGRNEEKVIASEGSVKDRTEGQEKVKTETQVFVREETTKGEDEVKSEDSKVDSKVSCSNSVVPCLDKLREELSCAICLEICFEPSTTSCGHSFCKKCLRSAADKCGKKCPKCRQLISNGRSCMVNTVLWNTIQLLFPQEVEARKAAGALNAREVDNQSSESSRTNLRSRIRPSGASTTRDVNVRRWGMQSIHEGDFELDQRAQRENFVWLSSTSTNGRRRTEAPSQDEDAALAQRLQREDVSRVLRRETLERRRRRRMLNQDEDVSRLLRREAAERRMPNQDEDAALALRLQREEFLEAFRGGSQERASNSTSIARANLRAMASRAINIRMRNRPV